MQTNPIRGRTACGPDRSVEHELLVRILQLHPTHLTSAELFSDLGDGGRRVARHDEHERAIRDLIAAGLLRVDGDLIVPTPAALTAEEVLVRSVRAPLGRALLLPRSLGRGDDPDGTDGLWEAKPNLQHRPPRSIKVSPTSD